MPSLPRISTAAPAKFIDEFKQFAVRGNMIDLAVGVIVGSSFSKIISSLVSDIVMPPLSLLIGRVDFANLFIVLSGTRQPTLDATRAGGAVVLAYGTFLNASLDFLLVALSVFLMVRGINRLRRQPAPETPDTTDCPRCLSMVSRRASRCPSCTSDLQPSAPSAALSAN